MGVLDQVIQMKSKGMSEQDIINNLQQQGIDPKSVNDALSQAQVKNAVTSSNDDLQGMQPSIMEQEENQNQAEQGLYQPQTREVSEAPPTPSQQQYIPQQMTMPQKCSLRVRSRLLMVHLSVRLIADVDNFLFPSSLDIAPHL